jgi:O-antigen ligase
MGYVALVFVLCLAIVCLRKDGKVEQSVSFAIWLPVLWMMRVASRSFAYWLGEWADPIILLALTVLGIIALRTRAEKLRQLCAGNRFLLLFFVYLTISVFWSTDIPVASKRWVRVVGDLSMALIVVTEKNPFVAVLCVLRRMIVVLIPLSLVLSMYFPDIGLGGYEAWIGVTVDKNLFGLLCFVASAYLLWHWMKRRRKSQWVKTMRVAGIPFEIPLLALSIYLLFGGGGMGSLSRSSTAIVLLALSIGVFCLIEYARKRHLRLASVITPLIVLLLFVQVLPRVLGFRSLSVRIIEDVLHKNVNLTDRAGFWPLLLKKGMAHPWFGSGFASFFTPQMEDEIQTELAVNETYFKPNQAHNGYLEVFLNLGVTGLLLLMLVIWTAFRNLLRPSETDSEYAQFRLVLLVCALVSNWTEASFGRPTEFIWFLFLLVAINPMGHAMRVFASATNRATVAKKPPMWEDVPSAGHANATTLSFNS